MEELTSIEKRGMTPVYVEWHQKISSIWSGREGFSGYERFRDAASKEFGEGNKPFIGQEISCLGKVRRL